MRIFDYKCARFGVVGAATALSYMALYPAFLAAGVSQPGANAVAFFLAIVLQYIGHALFTFRRRLINRSQITKFSIMVSCGFGVSMLVTGPVAVALGMPAWAAALAVALYLPVQNYILMTLWVFVLPHPKTEYIS
ncbi:GtrA family protein [Sulfitobacter sp. R86518]|uniref:GtrA family protein n=1 Tax=Sulfitobacter sp. R86518 TaxID=3093858 RepID=UPI0036DB2235